MRVRTGSLRALCVLSGLLTANAGLAAPAEIDVTATMPVGTCTTTPSLNTVALGDVDVSPLVGTSWAIAGSTPLVITLTCTGLRSPAARPTVKISGTPKTDSPFLFRDTGAAGGTSAGLYFVLHKEKKEAGDNTNDIEAKNGEHLYIKKPGTGDEWYGPGEEVADGATVPLTVGLACGRSGWCGVDNLTLGTVKATTTFTFEYK